jgi:hypothetical protein
VTLDAETAIWLADLFARAVTDLEYHPGLLIEVEASPDQWVQVIIESDEDSLAVSGFLMSFPYRVFDIGPLQALSELLIPPPPGTHCVEWEEGGFARLLLRPDVPLVGLAHFIGDVLERLVGMAPGSELTVQIEYGY